MSRFVRKGGDSHQNLAKSGCLVRLCRIKTANLEWLFWTKILKHTHTHKYTDLSHNEYSCRTWMHFDMHHLVRIRLSLQNNRSLQHLYTICMKYYYLQSSPFFRRETLLITFSSDKSNCPSHFFRSKKYFIIMEHESEKAFPRYTSSHCSRCYEEWILLFLRTNKWKFNTTGQKVNTQRVSFLLLFKRT